MINEIKGQITAGKGAYAIVVSRFNEFITAKLLAGAIDCLERHGAKEEQQNVKVRAIVLLFYLCLSHLACFV